MFNGTSSKRQLNGTNEAAPSSKRRLEEEYYRRMKALNRSFAVWVEDNAEANLLTTWEDGVFDYIAYAKNMQSQLATAGTLYTFGSGDCGQLGHGVDSEKDMEVAEPRVVKKLKDVTLTSLECGGLHNAVAVNGQLWTYGCADDGVLGREGEENFPAIVPSLSKIVVTALSAGDCHTTALSVNGDLFLWGTYKDREGKNWFRSDPSGKSLKQNRSTPMLIEELSGGKHGGVIQVSSGAHHTLALCANGSVYSWGIGDAGQLGRPVNELKDKEGVYQEDLVRDTHLTPLPMQFQNLAKVDSARSIACGGYHSFVINAVRGRVYGCGLNQYGQLGMAPPEGQEAMVHRLGLVGSLDGLHIRSIDAGEHFSVALSCEGKLYSFGRADQCQLGVDLSGKDQEAGAFEFEPQLVQGDLQGVEVVAHSCGSNHVVAIGKDGCAYSWGFGVMYQLGHPVVKRNGEYEADDEATPRKINGPSLQGKCVVGVSAGGQHTALLVKD